MTVLSSSRPPRRRITLRKLHRRDCRWPASAPELAALVDLGMDDETIGRYFHVAPEKVTAIRRYLGLGDAAVLARRDA